jgi:hypothetical protein
MGSPINDPHPNDALAVEEPGAVQEPEDFFGENGDGEEAHDESGADDEPAAESEIEEDETGNKRAYVVLQEIVLDQDALNELLKAVKGGVPPMKALIEVHRVSVTNPKSALNAAWKRHKDEWVEPPRLAVVTASKIRARKAKPKVREITGYTFED